MTETGIDDEKFINDLADDITNDNKNDDNSDAPTPITINIHTKSVLNNNANAYPVSSIYVCIFGQTSNSGFCYVTSDGIVTPMKMSDNKYSVPINASDTQKVYPGGKYADYSFEYTKPIKITEAINSGRIYICYNSRFYIKVQSNGKNVTGYAPPSVTNPSIPCWNKIWDFMEFSITKDSTNTFTINADLTQVDAFGIPMTMQIIDSNNNKSNINGIQDGVRTTIFNEFKKHSNTFWGNCIQTTTDGTLLRVISPNLYKVWADLKTTLPGGGIKNPLPGGDTCDNYWNDYVKTIWMNKSKQKININNYEGTFSTIKKGNKSYNILTFTDTNKGTVAVIPEPTSDIGKQVWGCTGEFANDASLFGITYNAKIDKMLKAHVAAGINRCIMDDFNNKYNKPNNWYINDKHNLHCVYYKIISKHNIIPGNISIKPEPNISLRCYAFAYDDVPPGDPLLRVRDPVSVNIKLSTF